MTIGTTLLPSSLGRGQGRGRHAGPPDGETAGAVGGVGVGGRAEREGLGHVPVLRREHQRQSAADGDVRVAPAGFVVSVTGPEGWRDRRTATTALPRSGTLTAGGVTTTAAGGGGPLHVTPLTANTVGSVLAPV